MMKKKIESPFRKLRILMVLPFIAMVFYAFAKPEYIRPASKTENVSAVNEGKEVKGKVTTSDGKPLPKAAVVIKGTTIGTITDAEGNFKLKDVTADAKLVISYVGMKTEELKPDFNKSMTVKMAVATVGLGKVVVTGGVPPPPPTSSSGKPAFSIIEQMPRYQGGEQALAGFIRDNMKYPVQAQEDKTQGTVVVNFLVTSAGKIENVKVAKSVNPALDAEAVRVVSKMPDWFPGKQNGDPVDVYYSIPFEFKLN